MEDFSYFLYEPFDGRIKPQNKPIIFPQLHKQYELFPKHHHFLLAKKPVFIPMFRNQHFYIPQQLFSPGYGPSIMSPPVSPRSDLNSNAYSYSPR